MSASLGLLARKPHHPTPGGATLATDPGVTAILADGWRATFASPPTFDPVGTPQYVSVRRQGYDGTGAATTVDDLVEIMARVRQPYPNHATLSTDETALAEFVYQNDTLLGTTAPNTSTRAYPQPQALWLNHDRDISTGSTYTLRLAVAHAHARQGRPVAAVRFSASDGTNTVTATVSALSTITYAGSGLTVPHFAADLDFSALTAGAEITIDATIFPWVGTAFTVSTDADTYPSPNLSVLKVLNDRTGSYGAAYAYVDAALGDDGTGVAHATPATAAAAPFATLPAAAAALQAHNNTTYSRNDASAGVVRLVAGDHAHASFYSVGVGDWPLIVEAADAGARDTTVYQVGSANTTYTLPPKVKFRNITLRRMAAGNLAVFDSAAGLGGENMLVFENCRFDNNGQGAGSKTFCYRTGRTWLIDCPGDDLGQAIRFSSAYKAVIAIGSANGSFDRQTYHAVGCRDSDVWAVIEDQGSTRPAMAGTFFGWNVMSKAQGINLSTAGLTIGPRGVAFVGNIVETTSGDTSPAMKIHGDGSVEPAENLNLFCNTVVGARVNFLYQDTGTATVAKSGRSRFGVYRFYNVKTDTFGTDANLTGNWPVAFKVGYRANAYLSGGNDGGGFGAGNWVGEIGALGDVGGSSGAPLDPRWADDASFDGTGAGGGDYAPGAGHALPAIPAGLAPYGHDLLGNAIADDGTGVVGAVQA